MFLHVYFDFIGGEAGDDGEVIISILDGGSDLDRLKGGSPLRSMAATVCSDWARSVSTRSTRSRVGNPS